MRTVDYPWAEPARTGLLGTTGVHLAPLSASMTGDRTPVVAVGSNASAGVLADKLGDLLATGLPLAPATVDHLLVGHSAHVSTRGYVAAAPVRRDGARAAVVVGWLDPGQLGALDRTEPNYSRVPLPDDMPCRTADGAAVEHAQVYASRHGVLADAGEPLPLTDQTSVLAWVGRRLPEADLSPEHLADPRARDALRRQLRQEGLRTDAGLGPLSP